MTQGDRILRLSAGVLKQAASGAPLVDVLTGIVGMMEEVEPEALGSIVLLDESGRRIVSAIGPSLAPDFLAASIGLEVGRGVGSCGEAMATGRAVVTEDIATDPNWERFRGLAAAAGVRACWSEPILDEAKGVIGSFAIYRRNPGRPSPAQRAIIGAATDLVRLAVETDVNRRSAERAEARLALAIEASGLGVLDYDMLRRELVCNARILELYDLDDGEGQSPEDLLARIHPEDRPRLRERYELALENALPSRKHAYRVLTRDGSVRHLRATTWVQSRADRAERLVSVIRDVTGEMRMSEALQQRTREAEAANFAKSQFLANMSHEIRTPLNGVLGAAQLLDYSPLDASQRRYVSVIRNSGVALLDFIDDLLELSRIEAGVIRMEPVPFDCPALAAAALDTVRGLAVGKGLELALNIDEAARGWFRGDLRRIRQVLLNLLSNAVKFTDTGRIGLDVSRTREGLCFSVTDTGCGIAPEDCERIFARFSQAGHPLAPRQGGTGLGLSICRELATLMAGRIEVESRLGEGSRFWLTLPAESCRCPGRAGGQAGPDPDYTAQPAPGA